MRHIMTKVARSIADLEGASEESAPPVIPPGVKAKVRVDYETQVEPANAQYGRQINEQRTELEELAGEEFPAELPLDPLSVFCAEWRNYVGYPMKVTRLADPATRRIPGQAYNRPCFEVEYLSDTPFDPANLTGTLQIINGNSGGVFRLWLTDESGTPIPDARLDRVVIADPPKHFGNNPAERREYDPRYDSRLPVRETAAPAPLQPSAFETRMQELQERLLNNALARLMEPTAPASPVSNVSDEDRLTLFLVKEGGILPGVIGKLTALVGSPETVTAKESWQERAINAGLNIAQSNPAIVERVSATIERIVDRVLPNTHAPVNVASNIAAPAPPQQYTPPQAIQLPPPGPSAPDAPDPGNDDSDELDDDIMDIIEQIFTLLSDTRPFRADDPVFVILRQEHPVKFTMAVKMIAAQPLDDVIEWIKSQGSLYEALLDGPVTGPHYRERLATLQQFCRAPAPQPNAQETSQTENQSAPADETA